MSQPIAASILTVGTEITSGEILNSNGQWLAEQLDQMGFDVVLHLSAPDDRKLIQSALDYCAQHTEVLIVTGGLGPTSDDFTREAIATWAQTELEFNDSVWNELQALYQSRGLKIREAHRQQCHFPKSSELLKNPVGTAHGFYLKTKGQHIFVLPGPPREIQGMWQPSVLALLEALKPQQLYKLYRWECTGVPESEVAEVVEKIIAGTGLRAGYRANKPRVIVKVWMPIHINHAPFLQQLHSRLSPWLASS